MDIEILPDEQEPEVKETKTKRAKPNPEHKEFLNMVVDTFLRPTRRRMYFLYPALCRPSERLFVLGSNPKEIVFGNPQEGLCLVQMKDQAKFDAIWQWLCDLGVDSGRIEAINFGAVCSALTAVKGDRSQMSSYREGPDLFLASGGKPVSTEMYSLFTMLRLGKNVEFFCAALTPSEKVFSYPLPVISDVPLIQRIVISQDEFKGHVLQEVFPSDIRMMVSRGYDLLCANHFKTLPLFFGMRFWRVDKRAILYAAVIETEDFVFVGARCNVFLIPV